MTKQFLVIYIFLFGYLHTGHGVSYRVLNDEISSKYHVVLESDAGLHDRFKRQVTVDTTQAPVSTTTVAPSPSPAVNQSSTAASTTTTTTTTTTTITTSTTTYHTTSPTTTPFYPYATNTTIHDQHIYYHSQSLLFGHHYYVEPSELRATRHDSLSDSHRSAAPVELSFNFFFYGHDVKKVTITTGGFLYMSDFLHQFLTATQYVAPLMANFDTTLGNESHIYYADDGSSFYVWWENVYLQDQHDVGPFTFQAQLHKTGDITFAYKQVPVRLGDISTENHPVKVGVSDAYYIDTDLGNNMKRRTIYEYHRVAINLTLVVKDVAIALFPVKVCHDLHSCRECVTSEIDFECAWCEELKLCSDGLSRHRQEWLQADCHQDKGVQNKSQCKAGTNGAVIAGIVLVVLLSLALVGGIVGWCVYAYRNPNSASGRWLIEHRPSQLGHRIAQKVTFWKNSSGSSGDKYGVSVDGAAASYA